MAQLTAPSHPWRLAAGFALAVVGAAVLGALVYVFNCSGEACERVMIGLGLGLSALIAAVGQLALIVGLRLIWLELRNES